MPAEFNSNIDDALGEVKSLTSGDQSAVDWASKVVTLLDRVFGVSNPFGSAALKNAGEAAGEVPVLNANGRLDAERLPAQIPAGQLRPAAATDGAGVKGAVVATGGQIPQGLVPSAFGLDLTQNAALRTYTLETGSWTKPTGLKAAFVICVSAGQRGIGRQGYSYTTGSGPAAVTRYRTIVAAHDGSPGEIKSALLPAAALPETVNVSLAPAGDSDRPRASRFGDLVVARLTDTRAPVTNTNADRRGFTFEYSGQTIGATITTGADDIVGYGVGGDAPSGAQTYGGDGSGGIVLVLEFM